MSLRAIAKTCWLCPKPHQLQHGLLPIFSTSALESEVEQVTHQQQEREPKPKRSIYTQKCPDWARQALDFPQEVLNPIQLPAAAVPVTESHSRTTDTGLKGLKELFEERKT